MLTIAAALSIFVFGLQGPSALQLPKKVLIEGVPFVRYQEVRDWKYANREFLNFTYPATTAMVLEYWGKPARQDYAKEYKAAFGEGKKSTGWAKNNPQITATFEELKGMLAKGIPVIVPTPNSVYGHYLNPAISVILALSEKKEIQEILKPSSPAAVSGILGRQILSLQDFQKIRDAKLFEDFEQDEKNKVEFIPIRESVLDHVRVLIGYDDERQVVTIHDPSFGPGMEIRYEDFLTLWKSMGSNQGAFWPDGYESFLATKPKGPPYRPRTSDEVAAEHYFDGYSLASTGKFAEADEAYQKGIKVEGLSDGFRHLFHLEIASLRLGTDRLDEAHTHALEASRLVPENPFSWELLQAIYKKSKLPDASQKAREAQRKMDATWKDKTGMKKLIDVLPGNFEIPLLSVARR